MLDKTRGIYLRIANFLFKWRSFSCFRLIQYVFMFSSVPMLAYGIKTYDLQILTTILFTILALFSGFFATLLWNDITDVDIDVIAHPDRPLPARRIGVKKMFAIALVFSATTFLFSLLVSVWCLFLAGMAALFVTFHNKYLKKFIKFPAYSEIFTPIQWVVVPIFGYLAIWTTFPSTGAFMATLPLLGYISFDYSGFLNMIILVLFTYFADNAHDLPEGIHDVEGDLKLGVSTYATSFGEKNAARISFIMFFVSGILGIILYLRTVLTPVFLVPFLILWLYALYHSYNLLKADEKEMRDLSKMVGQKTFRYFWLSYDLIFLDVLIQVLIYNI
ncbi:MAG: UbiA family prenyltransferase [Thermoplasmatales archaeon]|nr:MAG: UbiA family prenyltransferase [Thermoplasmatales archaeon]